MKVYSQEFSIVKLNMEEMLGGLKCVNALNIKCKEDLTEMIVEYADELIQDA